MLLVVGGLGLAVDPISIAVIFVLGLAAALTPTASASDAFSSVLAGLAVLFVSIFASLLIYRFVPKYRDDISKGGKLQVLQVLDAYAKPIVFHDGAANDDILAPIQKSEVRGAP